MRWTDLPRHRVMPSLRPVATFDQLHFHGLAVDDAVLMGQLFQGLRVASRHSHEQHQQRFPIGLGYKQPLR